MQVERVEGGWWERRVLYQRRVEAFHSDFQSGFKSEVIFEQTFLWRGQSFFWQVLEQ